MPADMRSLINTWTGHKLIGHSYQQHNQKQQNYEQGDIKKQSKLSS